MPDPEITRLAGEIARYLAEHPNAADSLEGITKWWLARLRGKENDGLVRAALDMLIGSGQIHSTRNPDGSQIFKANKYIKVKD